MHPLNISLKEKYKTYENNPTRLLHVAKAQYVRVRIARSSVNSRGTWKVLNAALNIRKKPIKIHTLFTPTTNIVNEENVIANTLNKYFTDITQSIMVHPDPPVRNSPYPLPFVRRRSFCSLQHRRN